jgi:L-lactate dehydrogenase (cytochrome)
VKAASISDYREAARRRLPKFLFEYIDGGSYAEATLRRNVEDLQAIALRQRVLRNVSEIDLSTELFGRRAAMPLALAPVGLAGMNARRGEVQAARAAAAAGVPFCLSTVSACDIDEVARGEPTPFWFQLYMIRDRGFLKDLLAKASSAGCPTLVFTVDMPVPGTRYRDYRSGLAGASGLLGELRRIGQAVMRPRWAWDVGLLGRPHTLGNVAPVLGADTGLEDFFAWMRNNFDPRVTWDDLNWVRENWTGPLVIKGILDPEDARAAVELGADGIVVSNHGGRQLDGAAAGLDALPAVVAAVDGRMPVLVDGGFRRGADVAKALALGATACLVARPQLWGLAVAGEAGVAHVLDIFRREIDRVMGLLGVTRIAELGPDLLTPLSCRPAAYSRGGQRF